MLKRALQATAVVLVAVYLFISSQAGSLAQDGTALKRAGYEDFSSWYLSQSKLKELPYRSATLLDASTLAPLYFHQETTVMPTASLMKLVTAGTMLRFQRDWYTPITFTAEDNEWLLRPYVGPKDTFSLLKLGEGEAVTLEQAFASMLVGSANNAAVAMARAVGLTREQFLAEMRVTAERWGLKRTTIDEPSGLSLNNTSSAEDMARSACAAYSDFMASYYGSSPAVTFTTAAGNKKTVLHTVHDLRAHAGRYFGAKTGYLTETKFHVVAGIISPQGHRLCAAVLTSTTRAESEAVLRAMGVWADQMYTW